MQTVISYKNESCLRQYEIYPIEKGRSIVTSSFISNLAYKFTFCFKLVCVINYDDSNDNGCLLTCFADGYFSSPATHYIIYENPVGVLTTQNAAVDAQLACLRTALMIATILDRVLVLPRFHCFRKSTGSFVECPLNSLLRITAFDTGFADRYRESTFLRHPLVPDAVRRSVSPRYYFATSTISNTFPVSGNHTNTTIVVRWNSTDSITDSELRQLLGTDQHRVISLASLEHISVTFKSAAQQKNYDKTVSESFKRSDYRQLARSHA